MIKIKNKNVLLSGFDPKFQFSDSYCLQNPPCPLSCPLPLRGITSERSGDSGRMIIGQCCIKFGVTDFLQNIYRYLPTSISLSNMHYLNI